MTYSSHRPLVIGIDIRYLSHGLAGGIHTYLRSLLPCLLSQAPSAHFVLYADDKHSIDFAEPIPSHARVRVMSWRSTLSSVINDRRIAHWMARDHVDVAHFPGNYGPAGPYALVVTVHDALNLFPMREHLRGFGRHPRKVLMMGYLQRQTRKALREAERIVTVSEHARQDLLERSHVPAERIVSIHSAAAAAYSLPADPAVLQRVQSRFALPKQFILADGIKNPTFLVSAWQAIPAHLRAEFPILFFSREESPRVDLQRFIDQQQIRFIARPTTEELLALMTLTSLFVFPSYFEGFGLPLVEAMSRGVPVIGSDRGSIPEVLGSAGRTFPLETPAVLIALLTELLSSSEARQQLGRASIQRASAFSWDATARRTLQVYHDALAVREARSKLSRA